MASLAYVEGIVSDLRSHGEDVTDAMDHLAEQRAELRAYASRYSARTRHWRPDDHAKALASKHARGEEGLGIHDRLVDAHLLGELLALFRAVSRWALMPSSP